MTRRRDDGNSDVERLHAYHDGELSGLARWRFERALRRSPALRRELDELAQLTRMLRAHEASLSSPDLWDAIALRLPAADARRQEAEAGARTAARPARLAWWKPAGAVVAVATVAAAVLWVGPAAEPPVAGGVVRWIDSGERSVMVLDDQPDTTIIWVLDAAREGARERSGRERA